MIENLRKTIEKLNKDPKEIETVKALRRQLKDTEDKSCKLMTDLGYPKVLNYPCKGNAIICSHSEIGKIASQVMTTKKCNSQNCKYFESLKINT